MTSKEKTIRKIESFKILIKEAIKQYGRVDLWTKLELEYYEEVLNDLEVLEILRENTPNLHYILGSNNYEEYKIICDKHDAETDVDEKDYKKIKEWVGGIFD